MIECIRMTNRSRIPEEITRAVRQQCFFGCVICGAPIFEYDHIVPYAERQSHEAENIALLCSNHHADKTSGRLSQDRVLLAKTNPFNLNKSQTSSYKIVDNQKIRIEIGTNTAFSTFANGAEDFHLLIADGYDLFTLHCESGWLTFSLKITDDHGKEILKVSRGEISVGTSSWDYKYEGSRLRIWEKSQSVLLDMELSNTAIVINKGRFLTDYGCGFEIKERSMIGILDFAEYGGRHARNLAGAVNILPTTRAAGWVFLSNRGWSGPIEECSSLFLGGTPPIRLGRGAHLGL